MFYLYKIKFESGRVYIGVTNNISSRREQHKKRFLKEYNDMLKDMTVINEFKTELEANVAEEISIKEHYDNSYNLRLESDYAKRGPIKMPQITFKGIIIDDYGNVKSSLITSIVNETSESGLTLFLYLQSQTQKYKWNNDNMANSLGWSLAKLKRVKSDLRETGWIDYWSHKGNHYMYVGKDQVVQSFADRLEAGVPRKETK